MNWSKNPEEKNQGENRLLPTTLLLTESACHQHKPPGQLTWPPCPVYPCRLRADLPYITFWVSEAGSTFSKQKVKENQNAFSTRIPSLVHFMARAENGNVLLSHWIKGTKAFADKGFRHGA